MNYARLIYKIIQISLIAVTISVVALLILGHFGYVDTVKPFVVQSGSMEPAIPTASIVFSLPQNSYQQGDIITFQPDGDKTKIVTHRVEFKLYPDGVENEALFVTAGDANEDVDRWEVRNEHIIGKAVLTVPYVGYLVDFAKKPQGFILLVIVPATIVIYEELKNLLTEIVKELKSVKKRYFKGETFKDDRTITNNKFTPPKSWMIIPIIGVGVFMITFTAGYFSDIEKSFENLFQAGIWESPSPSVSPTPTGSPPQIATYLVINELLYDTTNSQNPGGQGGNNRDEFVEIYNPTSVSVNVNGWILNADGSVVTLPNLDIPGEGFLVISGSEMSELETIYGQFSDNVKYYQTEIGKVGNGFDDARGYLILTDSSSALIDSLSFGNDTSIFNPSVPDTETGNSFEREPNGVDTNSADDFIENSPTPGN